MSENHTSLPRTEKSNPLTRGIDTWPIFKILEVMNQEDHKVAPVSYTHLDVYKRQSLDNANKYL